MLFVPALLSAIALAWLDALQRLLAAGAGAAARAPSPSALDAARAILQVPVGADRRQLRRAYRALARTYHPDAGGSEEMMKRLNEAYATLARGLRGDPGLRG